MAPKGMMAHPHVSPYTCHPHTLVTHTSSHPTHRRVSTRIACVGSPTVHGGQQGGHGRLPCCLPTPTTHIWRSACVGVCGCGGRGYTRSGGSGEGRGIARDGGEGDRREGGLESVAHGEGASVGFGGEEGGGAVVICGLCWAGGRESGEGLGTSMRGAEVALGRDVCLC